MFSVVLPVHNRAETVGRSVVSVLAQTFADLELVVVDTGSTDSTLRAVRTVADRRVRLVSTPLRSDAVRLGLQHARGAFVTVIDADTVARPNWLARVARLIRSAGEEGRPVDSVACTGVQHHRDHSSTEVPPGARCTRPGALVRRRRAHPDGVAVGTPEALLDWFEPGTVTAGTEDERQLRWATDAIATLGDSPIPSADLLARYATVGGLAAARLQRHAEARRLLGMARQLNRGDPRCWARWIVASVPPLSAAVWKPHHAEQLQPVAAGDALPGLATVTR